MLTPFGSGKEAESLGMKRSVYNKAVSFSTSKQEMNFSIGCLECLLPGQTKKKIYFIENKMFWHEYLGMNNAFSSANEQYMSFNKF